MVNFGPVAAEMDPVVWGTPANFNGDRVLAVLLHCTPVLGVSQTAALNRGRHLYSTGRPPRWALVHISSLNMHNKGKIDVGERLLVFNIPTETIWLLLAATSASDFRAAVQSVHMRDLAV